MYNHSCHCVCPSAKCDVGHATESMIFFSYVKMHFSYVKSNILCKWLKMLRNYVHARTFFTPKIHPHPITWPATRPGPPPDQASQPTRPATHPARHPTLPATPPSLPPHPACCHTLPATQLMLPIQPGPRWRCYRCDALEPSSSFC